MDYYQSLLDKMGRPTVDAFARLYVLPQGNHGMAAMTAPIDGSGKTIQRQAADDVESVRAARRLGRAEHPPGKALTMTGGDQTMPLCSYPAYPKYTSGPPLQASSYSCAER